MNVMPCSCSVIYVSTNASIMDIWGPSNLWVQFLKYYH